MIGRILSKLQSDIRKAVVPPPVPDLYRYYSREDCLQGRDKQYPLTPELEANLVKLLTAINTVVDAYGKVPIITSFYRPGHWNVAAGGAKASAHLTCQAVDFADPDGKFDAWCVKNIALLKSVGLRLESPKYTVGWVHLDLKGTPGHIFIPY